MAVERVAGSSWNQWPDVHGMGGRMPVESASSTMEVDNRETSTLNGVASDALTTAAARLLDEARRWNLLSPKSNAALQSILALEFQMTLSDRNALRYLLERMEGIGLLESEIRVIGTAIN